MELDPPDPPEDVARARERLSAIFHAAKSQAGLTNDQIAAGAILTKYPVTRLSSGRWVVTGLRKDTLRSILVAALGVSDETWKEAEQHFDHVNKWRKQARWQRVVKASDKPSRLHRYGRAKSEQPGRAYPSIDRISLDVWADGRLEGRIERIEPEGRRGALWGCVGRQIHDTVLLTFWPMRSEDGEGPQSDSAGNIMVQRENSKRRPWLGRFVKLERRPGRSPQLHEYEYWLSPPTDPNLVSATSSVAVLDFDNTLARGWILGPWMQYLAENGIGDTGTGVERLLKLFADYSARPGFGHDRLATEAGQIYADSMANVAARDVEPLASPFVSDYVGPRGQLFKHARALISGLRARGLRPVMITGAPGEVTEALMRELEIERCFPLLLEIDDGIFTGTVVSNRGVAHEKAAACRWLIDEQECEVIVAIGDSEGDRPMWRQAEVSIRVGGPPDADDVTISGVDVSKALNQAFWDQIPKASWLALVN